MHNQIMRVLLAALLIGISLSACQTSAGEIDMQATIDAGIAGTKTAQSIQATIDAAVQATVTAMPTPEVDAANLTEEELAVLIDQTVTEALTAYEDMSAAVTESTTDSAITDEEIAAVETVIYSAYYYVTYAEYLADTYYDYYGEYASAAVESLDAINQSLNAMEDSLNEISGIMAEGAATASAAIDQINSAVDQAQEKADAIKEKQQGWVESVKSSVTERENRILSMTPNEIASDRAGALDQLFGFFDTFKGAMQDGRFSPAELDQIGQLGANLRASLGNFRGDGELGKFDGLTEGLLRNASRGEWNRARDGFGGFERSMPKRRRP